MLAVFLWVAGAGAWLSLAVLVWMAAERLTGERLHLMAAVFLWPLFVLLLAVRMAWEATERVERHIRRSLKP